MPGERGGESAAAPMRLHRVRLRNYRGVLDSTVTFAADGVTVVEGPNEVGKTCIPEALNLLISTPDKSNAQKVRDAEPVHRDAGPEVEVEMSSGQYRFRYSKRWRRRPETKLEVLDPSPRNLTGRDAHDRVEAILEETLDAELWRALRIEQGTELVLPNLAVPSLGRALDRAAGGELSGGREDDLWERISAERDRYWTHTGRPKADRKAAADALAEARGGVARLEESLAAVESDATEVERRDADRRRLTGLRDAAERDEQELGARWRDLERLQEKADRLEAEHRASVEKRDRLDAEVTRREAVIADLAAAAEKVADLKAAVERSAPVLAAASAGAEAATEKLTAAAESLAAARAAQQRANEDRDHHRRLIEVEQLRERSGRVVEAQKALAEAEALLESNRVGDELLDRIEAASLDVVRAEAAARSAAASLVVTALADLELTVSGETVELPAGADREFPVVDDARLTLPGVVEVHVSAGGGAQGEAAALDDARSRLAGLCAEGGVSGTEEARRAAKQREQAERSRAEATGTIGRDLRDLTLDVMEQKIAGLSGRIDSYAAERLPGAPLPEDFEEAKQAASKADGLLAQWNDYHERCRRAAEEAQQGLRDAEQDEAVHAARVRDAEAAESEANGVLAAARRERPDADLRASLMSAQQTTEETASALQDANAAVEEADPDSLKLLLENARAATKRAAAELDGNEDSLRKLRARLELQGEAGLHEQLSEARARCERLERDHDRTESRAQAAKLLFEMFETRRAESRRRYQAPFKQRIEQFGRIVFGPSFEVELDDDLRLARRTLDGVTLGVEQLSVGAREQLGVLARLACAAIVSPDGGGAPVVLDDALGWSDPGRLARMGAAIAAAGRECQVIVLTCTPGRYAHVGNATVVALSD